VPCQELCSPYCRTGMLLGRVILEDHPKGPKYYEKEKFAWLVEIKDTDICNQKKKTLFWYNYWEIMVGVTVLLSWLLQNCLAGRCVLSIYWWGIMQALWNSQRKWVLTFCLLLPLRMLKKPLFYIIRVIFNFSFPISDA